jgi:hypothetical protein
MSFDWFLLFSCIHLVLFVYLFNIESIKVPISINEWTFKY